MKRIGLRVVSLSLLAVLGTGLGLSPRDAWGATYLVDFGRSNGTDGNITASPDSRGNHWNNISSATQATPANQSIDNLVSINNQASTIGVQLGGTWQSNGRLNGGLFSPNGPDFALLGNLAVETATEDYYFLTTLNTSGTVTLSGLDTNRVYHVGFFGSRDSSAETRVTTYSYGSRSVALVTTGNNIGSDGAYDGNDDTIATLYDLVPNGSGEIAVTVEVTHGGFGYINAMRIESLPRVPHGPVLIDFGRSNTADGSETDSPDTNGNYWNNVSSATQLTPAGQSLANLVDTGNTATGIGLQLSVSTWQSNGRLNGGLLTPQSTLLGDLAIETATEDYYYLTTSINPMGTITLSGLDPDRTYHVLFFGSRSSTVETRVTTYSYGGQSVSLTTTGTDIGSDGAYDGNDDRVAGLYGLRPNSSGQIVIQVQIAEGEFAYINAMKIQPNPTLRESRIFVDFGQLAKRHALGAPDLNGNWWDYITGAADNNTGLTNAAGEATSVNLALSGFTGGGPNTYNDGLSPHAELNDGLFAFTNVTDDAIFFPDSASPTMTLSGLDDTKVYTLTFYASRVATTTRTTTFAVGVNNVALTTSGTGIGSDGSNWNDDTVGTLTGLTPSSGSLTINLSATGGFGYINAMQIDASVNISLTNTVAMQDTNSVPLTGNSSAGMLVQLIAVGPDGRINGASGDVPGDPGGDDYLIPASNNPTHVGAGMAVPNIGQLLQTMVYHESLAGTAVYVRYWDAQTPTEESLFGNSPIFYLPSAGIPTQTQVDFLPSGSPTPIAQYAIPGFLGWSLILMAIVIALAFGRRYFREAPAAARSVS